MSTEINLQGQAKLVSGTNIRTVNSTSLLGSGDVAVQPTLVSGTNIKTVNGTSILGSGNIVAGGTTVSQVATTSFTQYQVPADPNPTIIFAGQITGFGTLGQLIDFDFLARNTVGGSLVKMRIYLGIGPNLNGAQQLGNIDVGSTQDAIIRYVRRYTLTRDVNTNWYLLGMDAGTTITDYASGNTYTNFFFGPGFPQYSYVIVTLNNSGNLLAATLKY
jgi:hypothetical protein